MVASTRRVFRQAHDALDNAMDRGGFVLQRHRSNDNSGRNLSVSSPSTRRCNSANKPTAVTMNSAAPSASLHIKIVGINN
jgi:hypothetical protein